MPSRDTNSPLPSYGKDMDARVITQATAAAGDQRVNLPLDEPEYCPLKGDIIRDHSTRNSAGTGGRFSSSRGADDNSKYGGLGQKGGSWLGNNNGRPAKSSNKIWARTKMLLGFW